MMILAWLAILESVAFASPPNNNSAEAICSLQKMLKLVRLNSELTTSNAQKDIIIANLEDQKLEKDSQIKKHEAMEVKLELENIELKQEKERQISELKQKKVGLKHEVWELQKKNEKLNDQMHEMRDRHASEINKFHGRMYENMSARGDAIVFLMEFSWNTQKWIMADKF